MFFFHIPLNDKRWIKADIVLSDHLFLFHQKKSYHKIRHYLRVPACYLCQEDNISAVIAMTLVTGPGGHAGTLFHPLGHLNGWGCCRIFTE